MTNTTIAMNVTEMVINAGLTTATEIESFITGLGRNVTIAMLDAALDGLMTAHTTKQAKAVKINHLARAIEMDIDELVEQYSAVGETPVADTNQKEEVQTMNEQEQINYRNQKAIDNSAILKKGAFNVFADTRVVGLTKEQQAMLDNANESMKKFFKSVGDNIVRVEDIYFYPEQKDATREERRAGKTVRVVKFKRKDGTQGTMSIIGEVTVHIPKEYMQIKFFNTKKPNPNTGKMGVVEWLDMNGYDDEGNRVAYDVDYTKRRNVSRKPAEGTGLLVLPIMMFEDGKPNVFLPKDKGADGTKWPVFKTASALYINSKNARYKDEPMYVADNNDWFNAQVTAYIQVFTGEFAQQDVRNIHAINKLCTTCANSVRLFQRDEVYGDLDTSRKSRSVLNPKSILELAQTGSNLPSVVCALKQEFVDIPATLKLNDAEQFDKTEYRDADGRIRYVGTNQLLIDGEAVNKFEYRAQGTKAVAEPCIHYHGNAPKSEAKVAAERAAKREQGKSDYVSPFYKELPQVERQFIQTLVRVEGKLIWIPKFPGEVENPLAVRVKSAGLTVVGAKHVFKYADKGFVAPTLPEDVRHNKVMSKINQIFFAAFNMWKLTEEQAEVIFELADNKPEDITDAESAKWDVAVYWLAQAIIRAQEREEARKYPVFAPHFFTTDDVVLEVEQEDRTIVQEKAELVEIHVDEVIGDFKESRKTKISMEDLVDVGEVNVYDKDGNLIDHIEGKKANQDIQALRSDYMNDAYDDYEASEFTRRLDDSAIDYVYGVIRKGTRYVVVGDEPKEVELVAGALQTMLQNELTQNYAVYADGQRRDVSFVSNVKRDSNPKEALDHLEACDEVKDYIAELLGL